MIRKRFRCGKPRNSRARRGYTLTEMAFVLLIVAIIFSGIWVAIAHIWENFRVQHTAEQMTKFTQNIREYYMNAKQFSAAGPITGNLDTLGLFPVEMRQNPAVTGGAINHPINNSVVGGSLVIDSENCPTGGTLTCFRVRMLGLDTPSCIALLLAVPASDADLGILGVGTQDAGVLQDVAASTITTPAIVTASVAQGWCNAGANNEVDWDFKLHN